MPLPHRSEEIEHSSISRNEQTSRITIGLPLSKGHKEISKYELLEVLVVHKRTYISKLYIGELTCTEELYVSGPFLHFIAHIYFGILCVHFIITYYILVETLLSIYLFVY